ncbi:glycosyltransferase family 2 protein [Candidatus Sumerlaeota bacterium]|nr:glycosyltransferase family 2 protein [Candidatus Sumerlaeota bacterium]
MNTNSDNLPLLAVIIVNFNSFENTRYCVQTLFKYSPKRARLNIIVIDNASIDNSVKRLKEHFPEINIIANTENVGFSRAVNQGLRMGKGADFFLLLNPDTALTENALDEMITFLQTHPEAGAVGCSLLLADGTTQISYGRFPSVVSYITDNSLLHPLRISFRRLMRRIFSGKTREKRRLDSLEVDWLMGACILFPADIIQKVGGLDERFFMYAEDADFCLRIRQHGRRIYYLPQVAIYHYHKAVSRRFLENTYVHLFNSILLYHQKHSSYLTRVIIRMVMGIDMVIRVFVYGLCWLITLGKNPLHRQRLRATLRVLGQIFGSAKPQG